MEAVEPEKVLKGRRNCHQEGNGKDQHGQKMTEIHQTSSNFIKLHHPSDFVQLRSFYITPDTTGASSPEKTKWASPEDSFMRDRPG